MRRELMHKRREPDRHRGNRPQCERDVRPEGVAPDDLWQASGWLRCNWILRYEADSPSGVCGLSASLNGQPIEGSLSGQNVAVWHQCAAPAVSRAIDLDRYGHGPLALTLEAADAGGNSGSVTKTVNVDPTSPTLTLSGPTDAPSTAGTQFVTASAGGSPSGTEGISCSVEGAPSHWYPGSTARFPLAASVPTPSTVRRR